LGGSFSPLESSELRYLDLRGAKVGPALDGRPLYQQVILKHVVLNSLNKKEKIDLNFRQSSLKMSVSPTTSQFC
jgi:hypothetical protein